MAAGVGAGHPFADAAVAGVGGAGALVAPGDGAAAARGDSKVVLVSGVRPAAPAVESGAGWGIAVRSADTPLGEPLAPQAADAARTALAKNRRPRRDTLHLRVGGVPWLRSVAATLRYGIVGRA
jgi:hypothetical protein